MPIYYTKRINRSKWKIKKRKSDGGIYQIEIQQIAIHTWIDRYKANDTKDIFFNVQCHSISNLYSNQQWWSFKMFLKTTIWLLIPPVSPTLIVSIKCFSLFLFMSNKRGKNKKKKKWNEKEIYCHREIWHFLAATMIAIFDTAQNSCIHRDIIFSLPILLCASVTTYFFHDVSYSCNVMQW